MQTTEWETAEEIAESKQPLQIFKSLNPSELATLNDSDSAVPQEYRDAVFPIVEDSFDASSASPTMPEKLRRTATWARLLFGIVPEEYLQISFDTAFHNKKGSFAVNAYDVKNAYQDAVLPALQKADAERKAERLKKFPTLACRDLKFHVGRPADGVVAADPFNTGYDQKIPCGVCRPVDREKWRKTQIAVQGEHVIKTPLPAGFGSAPQTIGKGTLTALADELPTGIKPPVYREEELSAEEVASLTDEHNALVKKIVPDESAQKHLIIFFDEGANRFRHPERFVPLFTAKDVRGKIESYKKILAGGAEDV